jgi:hypothetical protein
LFVSLCPAALPTAMNSPVASAQRTIRPSRLHWTPIPAGWCFGYGDAHCIWHIPLDNCVPLRFDNGQEPDDPPLRAVLVTGNLVYDTGHNGGLVEGAPQVSPPRYRWTVFVSKEWGGPSGLKFSNNLFHPGTEGVSNVPLE